jgi:hypothetical protein
MGLKIRGHNIHGELHHNDIVYVLEYNSNISVDKYIKYFIRQFDGLIED